MSKLTAERPKALEKLAAEPDSEIDFSAIAEIREIPPDALIGRFYRPVKTSITIRPDADVLQWLQATGEGYQTRIKSYLRERMLQQRGNSANRASAAAPHIESPRPPRPR